MQLSKWGTVREREEEIFHVVPIDDERFVLGGHICKAFLCWCRPLFSPYSGNVIVHNDPQRGGFDS